MTERRFRGMRASRSPFTLTERDLDFLQLVGLCRYIGANQLLDLFPSHDRARRRVRTLYDAGLLRVTLVGSTVPNILSLRREGLAVLAENRSDVAGRIHLPGVIRLAGIAHHLAIVDVRLYLAALASTQGGHLAQWSSAEAELGRSLGFERWRLEPDGIAIVELRQGAVRIAAEIDRGTQNTNVVVAGKLSRYEEAFGVGVIDELWIVTTAGERRLAHLTALVAGSAVGSATRVMSQAHVTARPVRRPAEPAGAVRVGTTQIPASNTR